MVDLDGLISGFELQKRIVSRQLGPYLGQLGVRRILVVAWDRKQTTTREYEPMYRSYVQPEVFVGRYEVFPFQVYSYLYESYSDTLRLTRAQETWRGRSHPDGGLIARPIACDLRKTADPP